MMFLSFTHALGKVPDIDNEHTVGRVHIHFVHMALIVRSSWKLELRIVRKPPGLRETVNRGAYAQVWQYGAIN